MKHYVIYLVDPKGNYYQTTPKYRCEPQVRSINIDMETSEQLRSTDGELPEDIFERLKQEFGEMSRSFTRSHNAPQTTFMMRGANHQPKYETIMYYGSD